MQKLQRGSCLLAGSKNGEVKERREKPVPANTRRGREREVDVEEGVESMRRRAGRGFVSPMRAFWKHKKHECGLSAKHGQTLLHTKSGHTMRCGTVRYQPLVGDRMFRSSAI